MTGERPVFPGPSGGVLSDVGLNRIHHHTRHGQGTRCGGAEKCWSDGRTRRAGCNRPRVAFVGAIVGRRTKEFVPSFAKLALALANKDRLEAAYQRDRVIDERRALPPAWGGECVSGNVVPFKPRAVRQAHVSAAVPGDPRRPATRLNSRGIR